MERQNRLQRLSDADVAGMAQIGSLEAYDELVRRFRGAVLMVARQSLRSLHAAEDVAQESFLLAFQALPKLQDTAKFPGWLYAITRHRAQRVAQREAKSEATEDSVLEHLIGEPVGPKTQEPLEALLHKEKQSSIRGMLSGLTPEVQTVLHLFYYEEWTAARIADFLSLPLTTIKWRLHAGKQQISRRLSGLLEENTNVRSGSNERDKASASPAFEDGGTGRTRRADGQLRKRSPELREALQCDCAAG